MKLVQFSNGKYGIRRGNWLTGYRFKDLRHAFWWSADSGWIEDCMGTLDEAMAHYKPMRHRVIKPSEVEA